MSDVHRASATPPSATPVDPLDQLLAASLSRRPEAQAIPNLAERAIARARALDQLAKLQRRSLMIHRWRLRLVYGVAVLLIILLVLFGGARLLKEFSSVTSTDDTATSVESATASTNTSTSTSTSVSTYLAWLGGVLFICTLAGLATESAIAPDQLSLLA